MVYGICRDQRGTSDPNGNFVVAAFSRMFDSAGPNSVGNVPGTDVWTYCSTGEEEACCAVPRHSTAGGRGGYVRSKKKMHTRRTDHNL